MWIVSFGHLTDIFFNPEILTRFSSGKDSSIFLIVFFGSLICFLLGRLIYLQNKNRMGSSRFLKEHEKSGNEREKKFQENETPSIDKNYFSAIGLNVAIWNWMNIHKEAQEWSPFFYSSLGYKDKEIPATKKNFFNLIHPDDRKKMEDAIERHLKENRPFNENCRLKRSSEEYIWFSCSGQASKDEKSESMGMLGSIKNIHDQINAIKALKQSNDDLDQFAYVTSHDLREPLRNIKNFSNFLMEDYEDKLDEEGKENLRTIQKLCMLLDTYLQDLFRYSRLSAENASCVNKNIKSIIEEVKSMILNCSEKDVIIKIPSNLPSFCCDPAKITIIFSNLFKNSIRYNKNKKKIISLKYKDIGSNQHQFWIEDNGIGINQEHWKDIFIIFRRLHNRKEYEEGSGMGLALIKKAVEKHNGNIWVEESTPGKGTVISFILTSLEERQTQLFEKIHNEELKTA